MIIAAYAGTGKTTLATKYPNIAVDFVCMPYKYDLEPDKNCGEAAKANPDNIMRDEWPYNYVSAIKTAMNTAKLLLIPTDMLVLMLLQCEEIPYFLCYPQRNAVEVYRKRFMERGNTEAFMDIFIGQWNERITALEQDSYGRHIVLEPHQFLEDVIAYCIY